MTPNNRVEQAGRRYAIFNNASTYSEYPGPLLTRRRYTEIIENDGII